MNTPQSDFRTLKLHARQFVWQHIRQLVVDVRCWRKTGICPDGRLHDLAAMLTAVERDDALRAAEDLVVAASLELIAEQYGAPIAYAHVRELDDGVEAKLQVLDGTLLQPSAEPIPLFAFAPANGEPSGETMTLQEVWNHAGGNRHFRPTRDEVIIALRTLDEASEASDCSREARQLRAQPPKA